MDHLSYLAAAYGIIFAAIFFYIMFLWRRQAELETQLRALEARLLELHHAPDSLPRSSAP